MAPTPLFGVAGLLRDPRAAPRGALSARVGQALLPLLDRVRLISHADREEPSAAVRPVSSPPPLVLSGHAASLTPY
jgi:hypothetical protein